MVLIQYYMLCFSLFCFSLFEISAAVHVQGAYFSVYWCIELLSDPLHTARGQPCMSALPRDSLQRNKEEITDRDGVKTIEELHVCMYSCKFSLLMYYYQYRPLAASAGMLYGMVESVTTAP